MSVYVDPLLDHGWSKGLSCHMFSESEEELHAFAHRLGLRRAWYQNERVPHYDLTQRKRALAVQRGAIELSTGAAVRFWRAMGWSGIRLPPLAGEEMLR